MLNIEKFKNQYEGKDLQTDKGTSVKITIEKVEAAANQWDYYQISAFKKETNENIGDLKLALMEDDKFEKYLGDILKYKQFRGDRRLNVAPDPMKERMNRRQKDNQSFDETHDAAAALLHRKGYCDETPLNDPETEQGKKEILKTKAYSNREKEAIDNFSSKELKNEFDHYIKKTQAQLGESYQQFINYHYKKPEVHFVEVNDDYRRQGVATLLYEIANEMVNDKGYHLYQSTTQTPQAQGVWAKQEKNQNLNYDEQNQRAYFKPNVPTPTQRHRLKV